jgi:AAA domain
MASPYATGVEDLIQDAIRNPAVPIVDKLLNRGDRLLIHGYEETYKSGFAIELARCIATGTPFFGELEVGQPLRVGIIETEMRNPGLGERLGKMFPDPKEVTNLLYLNDTGLNAIRRTSDFSKRVGIVNEFLSGEGCQVAIFDSSVDLFTEGMNPDKEQDVQRYFDELESIKGLNTTIHIRHDAKPKLGGGDSNKNNLIRGSSRWKEVPETVVHFSKKGNSHRAVKIEVGKLRYGRKPEDFGMRFDQEAHTIVPDNPLLWLLKRRKEMYSHEELTQEYRTRYGLRERTLTEHLSVANPFLEIRYDGRKRLYAGKPGLHPSAIWRYKDLEDEDE